jgi:hypothetical protein
MGNRAALTHTTADQAAQAFAACIGLDPEGIATPHSVAGAGQSFTLTTPTGKVTYTLSIKAGGCCWIHGAAGTGQGMTESGLDVVEAQAAAAGCVRVGFQTMRRGLIQRASRKGYRITGQVGRGYIIEKSIT